MAVTMYITKQKVVRIYKMIIYGGILKEQYDCKFVNEIYKLPIHEEILENAKNQLSLAK